ncbi:MAG: PrsW family intramembrane metalloprotease [Kofleriaceae bacterium]|nr:PrsW family intramembrane metalloprotease [Kofleriaceae bacterium]MCL4224655.1 PrsW family intramembrane metalloprotease [Myxococcales bacterium]
MSLAPHWVALAGAAPALAAMWYFDRLDRARPEPAGLRRKVAIFGALSVIPVLLIAVAVGEAVGDAAPAEGTQAAAWYAAFVGAAIPEELCKIGVVYWLVWRRPEFDERMDGIVYAARAGLGFALVENILYLLGQVDLTGLVVTWILRALLAVPGHALWTAMMGYLAARRRFDGRGPGIVGGFLLAVFLHGIYDVALFLHAPLTAEGQPALANALLVVPVATIILSWVIVKRMARTALVLDDADAVRAQRAARP